MVNKVRCFAQKNHVRASNPFIPTTMTVVSSNIGQSAYAENARKLIELVNKLRSMGYEASSQSCMPFLTCLGFKRAGGPRPSTYRSHWKPVCRKK